MKSSPISREDQTWYSNNMSMPFITSDGSIAQLFIPKTMSIYDAKRLKRVINSLYINQRGERFEERNKEK